ncbi:MAG TPA: arylamine N-acetyltransferase [Pyrinomonadaceae bacterium]|nr:arylamine N-acetyltransferase [Pyrinomonadaceae bacterium]
MNVEEYLKRINYQGLRTVTPETLRDLQLAHLKTVPFENLSIHAGEPIVLEEQALFKKIVERRRGGFCYECNGSFAGLLRALGFEVEMLAAGVARRQGGFGPIFDHMTLCVTLAERWLVDVGFGDSFLEPLLLDARAEQVQGTQSFRIDADDNYLILLRRNEGEDWQPQYRFTTQPFGFPDYEEMCRFHQTSPESHFTQNVVCSKVTEDGRITLSGMHLITTAGPQRIRDEQVLETHEEYERILRDQFGIVMKNEVILPPPR